jgi:hypothetical protein
MSPLTWFVAAVWLAVAGFDYLAFRLLSRRISALESGRLTQAQSILRATELIGGLLDRVIALEAKNTELEGVVAGLLCQADEHEEEIGVIYAELFEEETTTEQAN